MRRNRQQYLRLKEDARLLVHARIAHLNQHYRVPIKKVFIKNHQSRWGSCSQKGNLNFNYKLVFLPLEIVEYIVAHELCHLVEFNHGPRFWALVAQTVPNHLALRRRLRQLERDAHGILPT